VNAHWSWFLEGRNLSESKVLQILRHFKKLNWVLIQATFLQVMGRTAYMGVYLDVLIKNLGAYGNITRPQFFWSCK